MKLLVGKVTYAGEFLEVGFVGTIDGHKVDKVQLYEGYHADKVIGGKYLFHIDNDAIFNSTLVATCVRSRRLS